MYTNIGNFWKIYILGQLSIKTIKVFHIKVWIKLENSNFVQNVLFLKYSEFSHSPHLTGHSPHVASSEWVGQRSIKQTVQCENLHRIEIWKYIPKCLKNKE